MTFVHPCRQEGMSHSSCSSAVCPVVSPSGFRVAFRQAPAANVLYPLSFLYEHFHFCTLPSCFLPFVLIHIPCSVRSWDSLPPPQEFIFPPTQSKCHFGPSSAAATFFFFHFYLELCSSTTPLVFLYPARMELEFCLTILTKGGDHTLMLCRDAS